MCQKCLSPSPTALKVPGLCLNLFPKSNENVNNNTIFRNSLWLKRRKNVIEISSVRIDGQPDNPIQYLSHVPRHLTGLSLLFFGQLDSLKFFHLFVFSIL